MSNLRIYGFFTTRSPLSHISESISTQNYLSQDSILQDNGTVEEVFSYSGNAWRGQLRDLCASYFLNKLDVNVSLDFFHLLYSGGKIGGEQSINIEKAKELRKYVPIFSLFGGGIGSQIISGKMKIGSSYPLCVEAIPALPEIVHQEAKKVSYSDLTVDKSFTRMDDSKKLNLQEHIKEEDQHLLREESRKVKTDVSTQMIMTSELLITGVELAHRIDLMSVTDIELGAFLTGIKSFSELPYIGGQANKGHGLVDYYCFIYNAETEERQDLIKVTQDQVKISEYAKNKIAEYDNFIDEVKKEISSSNSVIAKIIGA